jgi:HAD superfamily hydrolase (TIGR01509 family)
MSGSPPEPRPPTAPDAVVFDCDGILVDTEICWNRAYTALFHQHGRTFTAVDHATLIGQPMPVVGRILAAALGFPTHDSTRLAGDVLVLALAELDAGAPARPGAIRLVRELADRGYRLAVASSAPRTLVHRHLAATGLTDAFPVVLCAEDTDQPKPHPDIYLRACARLDVTPARSIAIEDSPPGVLAARTAGMFVIGVPVHPDIALAAHLTASDLNAPHLRTALGVPTSEAPVGPVGDTPAPYGPACPPAATATGPEESAACPPVAKVGDERRPGRRIAVSGPTTDPPPTIPTERVHTVGETGQR